MLDCMALLDIVIHPDPLLREVCNPVENVDDELRTLLNNMAQTMYSAPGIGLAGPQVASLKRIIVVDVGEEPEYGQVGRLYKLINPEIIKAEGETYSEEGCLSIPEIRETVRRAENVIVKAIDEDGEELTIEASGLLSICLQHEIDHLNGVLFIDHLSRLKRHLVNSKYKKLRQQADE